MKDKVNTRVKFREPWRPFCPSLTAESMHNYLEDADDAEFMKNKPMELFFREDLRPGDFNDDTLDRALDRLYENNPTSIFMHIALKTAKTFGIERKFLHLDTTVISGEKVSTFTGLNFPTFL